MYVGIPCCVDLNKKKKTFLSCNVITNYIIKGIGLCFMEILQLKIFWSHNISVSDPFSAISLSHCS